nr:TadE family type IV pilus minor pilin [Arthrobacter silvisoli]
MKDRGAVTAEFAVALPAVLLLLALLLAGAAAGITQLRIEEAARAGARALARGEGTATVEGIAKRLAGDTATAAVSTQGEWLDVTVSARVGGPFGAVIPWTLTARASARTELPDRAAASRPRIPGPEGSVDFLVLGGDLRGKDLRGGGLRGDDGRQWDGDPTQLRFGGAVA